MNRRQFRRTLFAAALLLVGAARAQQPATTQAAADLRAQRRAFQDQELITARPFQFIVNGTDPPPRIIWRDIDEVRRLGSDGKLRVRWFDADLNEAPSPEKPGRWGAYVESTAPNGTIVRRAMTFFCRPPGFFLYLPDKSYVGHPKFLPGPIARDVWDEHRDEIAAFVANALLRSFNDTEGGAILIAGLSESTPQRRPATSLETAEARNEAYHLRLKLKLLGPADHVRALAPPRKRTSRAPVLHDATPDEAGVAPDAKAKIDAVCEAWATASDQPFVTLVARHGVIVTHRAFGHDATTGKPIDLNYRCNVASITKTVTAMLTMRFVDQHLIGLDDLVGTVFPDYPRDPAHVPTFRELLTHMSGLSGHGDFGGATNPYLENILLNGIDANSPGTHYEYSGMGFDLAAKAMEIVTGKPWRQVYRDGLFAPLGLDEDIPMDNASAGANLTARELATFAQTLANRGSYGDRELFSRQTFEQMLPEDLSRRYPGVNETEGIGMHWMKQPGLSEHTIGHGSLTGCMLYVDLDSDLIIVQVRRGQSQKDADWPAKLVQAVVGTLRA